MRSLVAILLNLALILSIADSDSDEDLQCGTWRGSYRDCTCGVKYRDSEQRCCNEQTCFQPTFKFENLSCTFQCENGGKFDTRVRACDCPEGYYGRCCEQGASIYTMSLLLLLQPSINACLAIVVHKTCSPYR